MINEMLSMALEHGIWTVLFCFLFLYMLKDSHTREIKYTSTIEMLGKQLDAAVSALDVCEDIKADCAESLRTGREVRQNIRDIKQEVESMRATLERL